MNSRHDRGVEEYSFWFGGASGIVSKASDERSSTYTILTLKDNTISNTRAASVEP